MISAVQVKPSSASPVSPAPIRLFSPEGKYVATFRPLHPSFPPRCRPHTRCMYAHALYGAGMRHLKRPVDALEKDLSSVATMVAGHKKLNTLFQVSATAAHALSCFAAPVT